MDDQKLFWGNFDYASILNKNLISLKTTLLNNNVINTNVPYFFYTGTGSISELENIVLSSNLINKFNNSGLFFYLYEPVTLRYKDKPHTNSYYSEFNFLDYQNIIAEELESISDFIKKFNLTNVSVFTCDYKINLIKKKYPNFNLKCYDTFIRLSSYNNLIDQIPNQIEKKFFSSNWRYSPHRHDVLLNKF
jgi:hypothetical protein